MDTEHSETGTSPAVQSEPEANQAKSEPKASKAQSEPEASQAQSEPEPSQAQSEPETSLAQSEPETSQARSEPETSQAQSEPGVTPSQSEPGVNQSAQSEPGVNPAESKLIVIPAQSDSEPGLGHAQPEPLLNLTQSEPAVTPAPSEPGASPAVSVSGATPTKSAPRTPRQRRVLTLQERLSVIERKDKGESARGIAAALNVGKTQIQNILLDKCRILERWKAGQSGRSKHVLKRASKYESVNTAVFDWFLQASGRDHTVPGRRIQDTALAFAKEIGLLQFTASNGWLESWKQRYGVKHTHRHSRGSGSADWKRDCLPMVLEGYPLADVFNVDETALFFRTLPTREMVTSKYRCRQGEHADDRITVLFAASAAGEKLKPLVVGNSENPACFSNIDTDTLGAWYECNENAWITSEVFVNWLLSTNNMLAMQERKILLLLDNSPAHPNLQLSHIKLVFLPPNTTTADLQPTEAGLVLAVKLKYRRRMLAHLLARRTVSSQSGPGESAGELAQQINVLQAITWLSAAWKELEPAMISACFARCGITAKATSYQPPDAVSGVSVSEAATVAVNAGPSLADSSGEMVTISPTGPVIGRAASVNPGAAALIANAALPVTTSSESLTNSVRIPALEKLSGLLSTTDGGPTSTSANSSIPVSLAGSDLARTNGLVVSTGLSEPVLVSFSASALPSIGQLATTTPTASSMNAITASGSAAASPHADEPALDTSTQALLGDVTLLECATFDDCVATTKVLSDSWEEEYLKQAMGALAEEHVAQSQPQPQAQPEQQSEQQPGPQAADSADSDTDTVTVTVTLPPDDYEQDDNDQQQQQQSGVVSPSGQHDADAPADEDMDIDVATIAPAMPTSSSLSSSAPPVSDGTAFACLDQLQLYALQNRSHLEPLGYLVVQAQDLVNGYVIQKMNQP